MDLDLYEGGEEGFYPFKTVRTLCALPVRESGNIYTHLGAFVAFAGAMMWHFGSRLLFGRISIDLSRHTSRCIAACLLSPKGVLAPPTHHFRIR